MKRIMGALRFWRELSIVKRRTLLRISHAAAGAAAGALLASPCFSATVVYEEVLDLDPATHIKANGSFLADPPGPAFQLNTGDILQGTITFANSGRLSVLNKEVGEILLILFQAQSGSVELATTSFSLLWVQGDYLGPATFDSTAGGAGIGYVVFQNLTNSSFSFSGVRFSANYMSGTATVFSPRFLQVDRARVAITEGVPEPATWGMMIVGFGAVGTAMRRRMKIQALAAF